MKVVDELTDEYQRRYYEAVVLEREARAHLALETPPVLVFLRYCEAMDRFAAAAAIRPPGDDSAVIRWNACVRAIRQPPAAARARGRGVRGGLGPRGGLTRPWRIRRGLWRSSGGVTPSSSAFNRPEKRNAIDLATTEALHQVLTDHARERCVLVLHSTTPGMFVAGADIGELVARDADDAFMGINVRLFERLEAHRWPTIAAVDGAALGGGCELAMACDLRVASTRARFAQPELNLGILAGAGANWRLAQLVGMAQARRMLYLGETLDAAGALAAGLVDAVDGPGGPPRRRPGHGGRDRHPLLAGPRAHKAGPAAPPPGHVDLRHGGPVAPVRERRQESADGKVSQSPQRLRSMLVSGPLPGYEWSMTLGPYVPDPRDYFVEWQIARPAGHVHRPRGQRDRGAAPRGRRGQNHI